jgi:hypothetical protein
MALIDTEPKARRETMMKTILIAVALTVAAAAPVAAEGFPNPYLSQGSR